MAEADSRREDGAFSKTTPLSLMEVLKCVERRRRRENQENLSSASSSSHVIGQLARRTLALRYRYVIVHRYVWLGGLGQLLTVL
jgi:hypothetical protein